MNALFKDIIELDGKQFGEVFIRKVGGNSKGNSLGNLWAISREVSQGEGIRVGIMEFLLRMKDRTDTILLVEARNFVLKHEATECLLKHLIHREIQRTEWMVQNNKLFYSEEYRTEEVLENVADFLFLAQLCGDHFMEFISTQTTSDSLLFYKKELNLSLQNISPHSPDQDTYVFFICFLFVRHLIGVRHRDSPDLGRVSLKLGVLSFLQTLLTRIREPWIQSQLAIKVLPFIVVVQHRALKRGEEEVAVMSLELIKFICFKTQFAREENTKGKFLEIVTKTNFLRVMATGLYKHSSLISREVDSFFESLNELMSNEFAHPDLTFFLESLIISYLNCFIESQRKSSQLSRKEQESLEQLGLLLLKRLQSIYEFYFQRIEAPARPTGLFSSVRQNRDNSGERFKFDEKTCTKLQLDFPTIFTELFWLYDRPLNFEVTNWEEPILVERKRDCKIETGIRDLASSVRNCCSRHILQTLLQIWTTNNFRTFPSSWINPRNLRVVDLLMELRFPLSLCLQVFNESQEFASVAKRSKEVGKEKGKVVLSQESLSQEFHLLSFFYFFVKYLVPQENSGEIYQGIFALLQNFVNSKSALSLLWILDILLLMGEKEANLGQFPAELSKFQGMIKNLLETLSKIITLNLKVDFTTQYHQEIIVFRSPSSQRKFSQLTKRVKKSQTQARKLSFLEGEEFPVQERIRFQILMFFKKIPALLRHFQMTQSPNSSALSPILQRLWKVY